jgi:hypothetical protein
VVVREAAADEAMRAGETPLGDHPDQVCHFTLPFSLSLSLSLALTHRKIVCVGGMFRITSLAAASSASARDAMVSAVVQQRSLVARAYCQRTSLDIDANHYCSKGNEDVVWCCC